MGRRGKVTFVCPKCLKEFKSKGPFIYHLENREIIEIFKLPFCLHDGECRYKVTLARYKYARCLRDSYCSHKRAWRMFPRFEYLAI